MSNIVTVLIHTQEIVNSHTNEKEHRHTLVQINKSMMPLFHFQDLEEFLTCICISEMASRVMRTLGDMSKEGIYSPMCVALPGFIQLMPVRADLNIAHDIAVYLNINGPEVVIQGKQYSRYQTNMCRSRQWGYQNHSLTDQHPLHVKDSYQMHEIHVEILSFVWGLWDSLKHSNQKCYRDDIVEAISHFAADQGLFTNDSRHIDNYISVRASQATDACKSLIKEAVIIGNTAANPTSLIDGPTAHMRSKLVDDKFYNFGRSYGRCLDNCSAETILRAWHAKFSDRFTMNRSRQWEANLQEAVKASTAHQQVEAHRLITQLSEAIV